MSTRGRNDHREFLLLNQAEEPKLAWQWYVHDSSYEYYIFHDRGIGFVADKPHTSRIKFSDYVVLISDGQNTQSQCILSALCYSDL